MTEIKEGALYKTFEIEGVTFEIYYGYESESERLRGWEPSPMYPDFAERPQYTGEGIPFTLAYADICEHYDPIEKSSEEEWCANCSFFDKKEECVGLCRCNERRKNE